LSGALAIEGSAHGRPYEQAGAQRLGEGKNRASADYVGVYDRNVHQNRTGRGSAANTPMLVK